MEFRFDGQQAYQISAIEAVADLFDGQPLVGAAMDLEWGSALAAVPNRLDLDEGTLIHNLQAVQGHNGLTPDAALCAIEDRVTTAAGEREARFFNFSVEMETGTGKTYVYLRTALELYRRYGMRKFIIVVPSVAIREGVLKTLQMTGKHFRDLYGNTPYRYAVYDSANLSTVRQFALSDSVEFLIMTIDAFNKASNVVRQATDRLQGETPIFLLQAARPILILDEPQNMESALSLQALAHLCPLFALRYSATHKNPYNLVYRLTPVDAYRQGLVKRIEVASVVRERDENEAFVKLLGITYDKRTIRARLTVHRLMKTGAVKEAEVLVGPGDSLAEKTGRSEYEGYEVEEIDAGVGCVRFANQVELSLGETRGADREGLFAVQIEETIRAHFQKQQRLRDLGIKVLSLFFIDRVDNYAPEGSVLKRLFVEAFDRLKSRYTGWETADAARVQAAYFAERRHKGGVSELVNSTSGKTKEDEDAYHLIMQNKERLLSFDEPVAFIFSHSALREGWDSPNVFQICTLNQTASEMKKRQEIGRGVRLAVDQSGERNHDVNANVLTVVANESYDRYVARLQSEIADEYGADGVPPPPPPANRSRGHLRKRRELTEAFKELWQRISRKTRYAVHIDSDALVAETVQALKQTTVEPPRYAVRKGILQEDDLGALAGLVVRESAVRHFDGHTHPDTSINILAVIENLLEYTTPAMRVSRRTMMCILDGVRTHPGITTNPHEFAQKAATLLKERLAAHLVNGIRYFPLDEWYEMALVLDEEEVQLFGAYLIPADMNAEMGDNSLYDRIACDSRVEKNFAEAMEARTDVKLFVKLPRWFTVPTPVGDYIPDWGIVKEDADGRERLYLVRETKSTDEELRPTEQQKTLCGERHFRDALGVDYRVVSTASEV